MKLYIDPGTGSMLFTILIGVLGALVYFFRNALMKLKFTLTGGKKAKTDGSEIPVVIFTDSKRYWNLFRPICEELEKRKQKTLYLTASEDDPALSANYEFVKTEFAGSGNRAFARMNMIRADVVLSSTPGLDVYQWKRSRDVKKYVHIPHGIYDFGTYRMFGLDYYDTVLLAGPFQGNTVRATERERALPEKELRVVGMPYMDEMLKRALADRAGMADAAQSGSGRSGSGDPQNGSDKPGTSDSPASAPTVLLAPSWGKSAILSRYGEKIFEALLKTEYHIIVRPHPQSFTSEAELMERLQAKYPDSDRLEWDRKSDNYDSLSRADVLISDFSGVVFDYAFVFEKPVIYADTSFDPKPYDASWVEGPMWHETVLPKIGVQLTEENAENIGEVIRECLDSGELKENIRKVREESWQCIGQSAEKVVDYLVEVVEAEGQSDSVHSDAQPQDTRLSGAKLC